MTLIKVPRPPKSAYDPNRPVSALLKAQIDYLHHAARRLPLRYRSEIYVNAIKTEGEAARYIREVTQAIQDAIIYARTSGYISKRYVDLGDQVTAGQLLAENVRQCRELLKGQRAYVWNDMFDPNHNAVRNYALVNGDLAGSWEGLPSSVGIVNWNPGNRGRSLRFFADRGHRQVIAGYYDGPSGDVVPWLEAAAGVPRVDAVMYTTWQGRYDDLEAFAETCRGRTVGKSK